MNNKLLKTISTLIIFSFLTVGCNGEKDFNPPNKDSVSTGSAINAPTADTAMKILKYSDKMAKVWNKDATLMSIEGLNLANNGIIKSNFSDSKWIYRYLSTQKDISSNSYTIMFDGTGKVTWTETTDIAKIANNISNFSLDSSKAIDIANKNGLPAGVFYSMMLENRGKGIQWIVGCKIDEKSEKYEIKKIDAISGNIIE